MGAAAGSVAARARRLGRDAELGVRNGEPLRRYALLYLSVDPT